MAMGYDFTNCWRLSGHQNEALGPALERSIELCILCFDGCN